MLNLAKRLIISCFKLYFHTIFKRKIHTCNAKTIYIFDIDNTLADTWPSFNIYRVKTTRKRLLSLAIFINMRNLILKVMNSTGSRKVIFLTARSYLSYLLTYYWLKTNAISVELFDIIIVNTPDEKVQLIQQLSKQKMVVYFDDLSYNHENNEVKFYEQEINEFKKLKIKYYDYIWINKFNRVVRK